MLNPKVKVEVTAIKMHRSCHVMRIVKNQINIRWFKIDYGKI